MCGRFVINIPLDVFLHFFGLKEVPTWPAHYNVAPIQSIPVIRGVSDGGRQLAMMRWGLVPAWAKELGAGLINARSETANKKPFFRQALHQRR